MAVQLLTVLLLRMVAEEEDVTKILTAKRVYWLLPSQLVRSVKLLKG
jgi:hypothetical protein